jgi:hypothetical protein
VALALGSAGCDSRQAIELPLRLLTLYETGLGYYERSGSLGAGESAQIPLEPGQLDDVLKTLVVSAKEGVASIEYEPPLVPRAAAAEAGLDQSTANDLGALLLAMQGVLVEVRLEADKPLEGRLMAVEKEDGVPSTLILFGRGGLFRAPVEKLTSLKPLDPSVHLAWDRAARAKSSHPGRAFVRINAAKGGAVAIGYTTEAAVWRTTYRLLTSRGKSARIQGFAIVHNGSDEAWSGVRVSLVSGRPRSFLFPIAAPRYGRRELVGPQDALDVAPQLATTEAREHLNGGSTGDSVHEAIGMGGLGTVGYGAGGGGYGEVSTLRHAGTFSEIGPAPIAPAAVSEAGDLFIYTVRALVDLGPRKSALLPIIDSPLNAEEVSIIDHPGTISNGVRIANDSAVILEGGVVSVFNDGAFAGEAQIDRVKPGEVRVVAHGEDLDVEVKQSGAHTFGEAQLVKRAGEMIGVQRIDQSMHDLDLTSRSDRPRVLLLALDSHEHARVVSGAEEDVRSPGQPRYARLSLGAHERMKTEVVEEQSTVESMRPDQMTTARIDGMLASRSLPDGNRRALQKARVEAAHMEIAVLQEKEAEKRLKQAETDVQRLRKSVSAAGGANAGEVASALARRLLAAEDHVEAMRAEKDRAQHDLEKARAALLEALE